jgi:malonyl-CoA O-methyltransferase
LQHAGLTEPVLDAERLVHHYPDVRALLSYLKTIGARNAAAGRARGLTSPRQLGRMLASYEQCRAARGIPATWEVIYAAAFGAGRDAGRDAGGEARIPIASIRRRNPGI